MADIKISALPAASTLTGAETIPLVQGGVTKKVTTDQFLTAANPSYTGTLTGGTGVVNLGSGQVVKDASGNFGLGVTPSAWAGYKAMQAGTGSSFGGYAGDALSFMGSNAYNDNTNWRYVIGGNAATRYQQGGGIHAWFTAPSGTADNAISFTQAMTLDASGNLLVGTTTAYGKFTVGDDSNPAATIKLSMSTSTTERGFISMNGSIGEMRHSAGYGGYGGFQTFYTNGAEAARIDESGNLIQTVNTTAATLSTNGTLTFSLVSDTSLRVSVRGSDGVTRTATLTLA